jgi:hypothetical protein
VLKVIIGLLKFVPHFLMEPSTGVGDGSFIVELVFLASPLGALAAAVGIYWSVVGGGPWA